MSVTFNSADSTWSVYIEINKKRFWCGNFFNKEEAVLADRVAIENQNQFFNAEQFRVLVSDKLKARSLFKENISSEASELLSDKREYLPFLVKFKGKIESFGYVHRRDIDDAVRVIKNNKTLAIRDISMILTKTVRKTPKAKLTRIQYYRKDLFHRPFHILYVDEVDLEKWELFAKENNCKFNNIEMFREKFKETFYIVDIEEAKKKEIDRDSILNDIEKIEIMLKNLKEKL